MNSSHPLTLRGFLNEFSCFTSLDVRTVTLDPLASTVVRSWCARIVRFTAWGPKFTICKHSDITGIWSFQSSKITAVVKWVKSTTHRLQGEGSVGFYLYPQEAILSVFPGDSWCRQWIRVVGYDWNWMNHSATWFTEKHLHPVTRSSILLPGVEDYCIWEPPD